jgi:hypothetical protein
LVPQSKCQAELPHSAGVLLDEAAAEAMQLLDITTIPTLLRIDAATGAIQRVALEEDAPQPLAEAGAATATTGESGGGGGGGDGAIDGGGGDAFAEALRRHEAGEWAGALAGFARVLDGGERERAADAAYNLAALLHMLGKTRLAVHYTALVRIHVYINPLAAEDAEQTYRKCCWLLLPLSATGPSIGPPTLQNTPRPPP